ncbi:Hypothetical protein ETEE_4119 [Edwardsiella anguillarum ET080813]|uniref:Uncharacterized protein n=1 Tax=Edwardsiella anguillarum ET080813 TaxID=667120 RepID=A0A076LPI8_9GAMM|nr:Hypothetical protein ETEE_4119 [Edwardsiella anguillarum ET080813]
MAVSDVINIDYSLVVIKTIDGRTLIISKSQDRFSVRE